MGGNRNLYDFAKIVTFSVSRILGGEVARQTLNLNPLANMEAETSRWQDRPGRDFRSGTFLRFPLHRFLLEIPLREGSV